VSEPVKTMKIDLYTKIVLTVIAVCLVSLALRDVPLMQSAVAQEPQLRAPLSVNIAQIDGKSFGQHQINKFVPALPVVAK
jgi:hypothetical protein